MNKNFLKKIQNALGESAGSYCGCFEAFLNRTVENVYSGKPFDCDVDDSKLPKDFCGKCRKPVNDEFIESFYANLEVILPAYESYFDAIDEMPETVGQSSGGAAQFARKVGEIPVGMLSRSDVAARLKIELRDVERHIRSGRLRTAGGNVTQDSFDELKALIRRKDNEM